MDNGSHPFLAGMIAAFGFWLISLSTSLLAIAAYFGDFKGEALPYWPFGGGSFLAMGAGSLLLVAAAYLYQPAREEKPDESEESTLP